MPADRGLHREGDSDGSRGDPGEDQKVHLRPHEAGQRAHGRHAPVPAEVDPPDRSCDHEPEQRHDSGLRIAAGVQPGNRHDHRFAEHNDCEQAVSFGDVRRVVRALGLPEHRDRSPDQDHHRSAGLHFTGGTVLPWQQGEAGRGALLTGDIIQVPMDRRWTSFLYSYPNHIPERPRLIRRRSVDRYFGSPSTIGNGRSGAD